MPEITLRLTKAEIKSLLRRDIRYRAENGEVIKEDRGATIDWASGVRKSKARRSAELKILSALLPPPSASGSGPVTEGGQEK